MAPPRRPTMMQLCARDEPWLCAGETRHAGQPTATNLTLSPSLVLPPSPSSSASRLHVRQLDVRGSLRASRKARSSSSASEAVCGGVSGASPASDGGSSTSGWHDAGTARSTTATIPAGT